MTALLQRLMPRRRRARHLLAIDIGSNTAIRSVLIETDPDGTDPQYQSRRDRELPDREEIHTTVAVIQNELRRVIFEYVRELRRVPDQTLIGLGSHFTFNSTERMSYIRPKAESMITMDEVRSFLADKLAGRKTEYNGNKDYHLAIATPFVIEADGYRIEKLSEASRARNMTFTLLNTYALHGYWQSLQNLRSMLGGLKIDFISNQAAIAGIVVDLLAIEEALIVKIGAKKTEISYLKSSAVELSGQFSFGGDDFTREIADALSIPFARAEELKKEAGKLAHDPATAKGVKLATEKASRRWLEELTRFLDVQSDIVLPETIFLLGGGARLEAVKNAMVSPEWSRSFTFLPRLNVVRLDGRDISRMIFEKSSSPLSGPEEMALVGLVYRLLHKHEIFEAVIS